MGFSVHNGNKRYEIFRINHVNPVNPVKQREGCAPTRPKTSGVGRITTKSTLHDSATLMLAVLGFEGFHCGAFRSEIASKKCDGNVDELCEGFSFTDLILCCQKDVFVCSAMKSFFPSFFYFATGVTETDRTWYERRLGQEVGTKCRSDGTTTILSRYGEAVAQERDPPVTELTLRRYRCRTPRAEGGAGTSRAESPWADATRRVG